MNAFEQQLEQLVGERLKRDEPLAKHSHYNVGGPAAYFVLATSSDELSGLIRTAIDHDVSWVVLGGGTNILVNDTGFDGLVVKAGNRGIEIDADQGCVMAEAGVLSSMLARQSAEAGLTGFEWGVGLPGTIGGAVRGNAGCFGGETKDQLVAVDVLDADTGEERSVPVDELEMGYRHSVIKDRPWIVLRAHFQFEKRDAEQNLNRIKEVLSQRLDSQPKNAKCAGCAFKNVEFDDVAEIAKLQETIPDMPESFIEAKRIPAGWLVDQLGLKGTAIGGASVSEVHGNFITSDGTATADQIAQLISLIKTKVRDAYGIQLHEEIQYVGF